VRGHLERELGAAVSTCEVKSTANTFGEGIVLFCRNSPAPAAVWIHTGDDLYTVNERARSLTPRLKSMSEADADVFRRMGLDAGKVEQGLEELAAAEQNRGPRRD
jgi:hypothetical protein